MIDNDFTQELQDWLAYPEGVRDIAAGAELLLRLNRNRILYANILRRPRQMASKLEYELRKHLRIRLDGLTTREVALAEQELLPKVDSLLALEEESNPEVQLSPEAANLSPHRGLRADHDRLPEDIRQIYEKNGEVWRKLKEVRETLRSMEDATPCDRYEYCKMLKELDQTYRANWAQYDAAPYVEPAAQEPQPEDTPTEGTEETEGETEETEEGTEDNPALSPASPS